jgi:hypothetical protein
MKATDTARRLALAAGWGWRSAPGKSYGPSTLEGDALCFLFRLYLWLGGGIGDIVLFATWLLLQADCYNTLQVNHIIVGGNADPFGPLSL